jgi:signal transduction histidine kinase
MWGQVYVAKAEMDESTSPFDRVRNEDVAALHRAVNELSFLAGLARTTSSALDPDELFDVIIRETCRVLEVPVCSLYVVHDGDLVLRATNGLNPAGVGVARMPIGVGITGEAARLVSMIPLADATVDPRFHWIDGIDRDEFTAMCSVPLVRADARVVGVLNVQRQDAHDWTSDEQATLTAIASQLAGVIERSQLHRQLEEQLASEQEVSERWRQLTQARSDLLSMVSHDVRTPLAIALTYVTALRERLRGEEQLVLEQVAGELEHITRMVETILSALAVESGVIPLTRRDVDLVPFLRDAVVSVSAVSQGRSIRLAGSPAPLVVEVDADRLRQVVQNLLLNAAQHSPEGGAVVVELTADENNAVIAVSDDGPGVPEGMREAVFERFRQRRRSGTGIGLFVVRTIVQAHGGSVGVESGPEGGARFWVRLPINPRT